MVAPAGAVSRITRPAVLGPVHGAVSLRHQMTFQSFCLLRQDEARVRAQRLVFWLQQRRIVRERHATHWRLWQVMEDTSPYRSVA